MKDATAQWSSAPRRRLAVLAALGWWGASLAVIPHARAVIEALRAAGLLVASVTVAASVIFVGLVAAVARWRRAGALDPRQAMVALALIGAAIVGAQLLQRPEDRWHALQYGLLGALLWPAVRGQGAWRWGGAVLATATCGWLDEAVQFLVPTRVYDVWDAGLNATAGAVGVGIVELSRRSGRRSRA